jgi:hypothetical protein
MTVNGGAPVHVSNNLWTTPLPAPQETFGPADGGDPEGVPESLPLPVLPR